MEQINAPALGAPYESFSQTGLSSIQVKAKLDQFGENTFKREKINRFTIFCRQFINPLSFILMSAAGLSVFMGEYSDAVVIMVIVLLNSFLSFIQEYRSSKAVEQLSQLIERKVLVIRNNEQVVIDASQLVPEDLVILRGGDVVPADLKIIESYNLSVNESQLTGESVPVSKGSCCIGENDSLLFTGSIIERGHCKCVVIATGNQSELGKIAQLSNDTKKVTPYQKSLAEFSISLLRMIAATIVLMVAIKAFTIHNINDFGDVLIFAIALAMTVVPEALPMITTLNLSYGALQLAKQKVIVKKLTAIEGMGRINLLCTDKTGTLTEDSLTVSNVVSEDAVLFQTLAYVSIEDLQAGNNKYINSFDRAFLQYVPKEIIKQAAFWIQLQNLPFDPAARRRRVIVQNPEDGKSYLVVVGAPETLIELSKHTNNMPYKQLAAESGKKGMRQLAIAYKEIIYSPDYDMLTDENDLEFLGFAELLDPLRQTAKSTIDKAKQLGVDVKILTGDSLEIAEYVSKELGLTNDGDKIYAGDDLERMTDAQFDTALKECSVFARVTPEQKYNIIKCLKKQHVVGYQGDGINDAPSLKLADVAIAVHNATDVAKDCADIVLLEDDLGVILDGIQYGRSIFVNINKYIKHAMIGNLGNFFSMIFFYVFFAADIPMLAIQLLIGNIIQDMPLMTVFSDSVDPEEVRNPQAASQVKSLINTSLGLGTFTAVYYLLFFLFTGTESTPLTQTTLFLFYNFTQLLIIISVRSKKHFFWQGAKPSRLLLGTIGLFIAVSIALVYIPFTAGLMGFVPLPLTDFGVLTGVTIAFICLLDLAKVGLNKLKSKVFTCKTIVS
jgi:Mg2+-importing ATPase